MNNRIGTIRKAVPIIAASWALSLLSLLLIVYLVPDVFTAQSVQNNHRILRFTKAVETQLNTTGYSPPHWPYHYNEVATFAWNSKNTLNSILAVYSFLEYRCDIADSSIWEEGDMSLSWELLFYVEVNGFHVQGASTKVTARNQEEWNNSGVIQWNQLCCIRGDSARSEWINPNQNSYVFEFTIMHGDGGSDSTVTYVRNITLIVEVVDG